MSKQATAEKPPIRFRLLTVAVEQYVTHLPKNEVVTIQGVDVVFTFELEADHRRIIATPRFAFQDEAGTEIVILQPRVAFDINAEDWPRLVTDSREVVLPSYLLQHLGVIATGFARGVLHEKFSRKPALTGIMLPIIPVINYISEDLVFSQDSATS